ncbi:3-carboxy-cis,cis-muconate cycloisomerase [Rhodovulum sp. ES.010]|uniref:class-II fumarase/aspartase family protein n=1 Tax=Rhodovulum sp. ES.010 TaxID=1882821 RepID=UPI000926F6B9|nr:adenylosuccinate lyase family protein [Rhodovulum sp. ES.010]SIO54029.1 3-carboxy-cis,cis-muconate cycloisomerase [Rhodovulum sp. ES.010]
MAVSPFDSALYRGLFHDEEVGKLFTDSAEVRAMLLVEGALAKVQGQLGVIPEVSGAFIHRAAMEFQLDPAGMAAETGKNAVPVPALVAAFRKAMEAPEHAQYVHWGATSQDIVDTALVLRLRQAITILEGRLRGVIRALGAQAETNADLPMAARTLAQVATPTSFGAVVAGWGWPLIRHLDRLAALKLRLLRVSLFGAAGTLSAMGPQGPEVRKGLAEALGLGNAGDPWHAARDGVAELSGWLTGVAGSLAKTGEDLVLMAQSEVGEVRLGVGGASSTLPHKQNPVDPLLLTSLARHLAGLDANIQGAAAHRQQRDAAAWMVEWLALPEIVMGAGRALTVAEALVPRIAPLPDAMARNIDGGLGLAYAEALSFALADRMPRPEAKAAVEALCREAMDAGRPLADLAARDWPGTDWAAHFTPAAQMGEAPAHARRFATAAIGV